MAFGGRQGDNVTTTGGPEHSLAEPGTDETIDYPIVVNPGDARLDGDDIVIEPAAPSSPGRRSRTAVVAGVILALVVGGIALGLALANRDDGGATNLRSVAPAKPSAAPATPNNVAKPPNIVKPKPVTAAPSVPVNVAPPVVEPNAPVASPTIAPPPPPPPVEPTPPVASPSDLRWTSTPASITVKGGGHKTFTVTVTNPTDGTVTLPHPLSCAPVLRGPKGVAFGFGVCVEMAQVMAPHEVLTQTYTIYATDTASADGNALKPGNYTATVENLFVVPVHITAS